MLTSLLLKGAIIGFSIAMPVGPIGLLCMRNSLTRGIHYGLMTGLGAAVADTVYGAVAGFSLISLMTWLISYKMMLQFVGGVFLCYLGFKTFLENAAKEKEGLMSRGHFQVFLSTFFLTLTNPMTILSFVGIYAGLGVGLEENSFNAALILTSGVFLGSALWWILLSSSTALFKNRINVSGTKWLNRISGSILVCFGLMALWI